MKLKKLLIFLLSAILAFSLFAFTGCGGGDDGKIKLKVAVFKAGFGDEWLKATAEAFEKENPDVKIVIESNVNMDTLVRNRLEAGQFDKAGDIFSVTTLPFFDEFIRKGYLQDLTELYDKPIEGEKTLNNTVVSNFFSFVTKQDKKYGVPWEGAVTGFAYNSKLFKLKNWEVPKTMTEFYELCKKIKAEGINPLVYCGAVAEGYFQNPMMSWMAQYEGVEDTKKFFDLETPEVFQNQGRLKAYQEAAKIISNKEIVMTGSKGFDHLAAQREFIKGNAAMIPAGSWLQTEMKEFLSGYPNFEMGMFAPPYLKEDKTDKNGNATKLVSTGNCDVLAINAKSKQKELAEKFMLFMSRQDSLRLYTEKTGGNPRPFKYDNNDFGNLSNFGQDVMNTWNACDNIFPYSDHPLALSGKLGFWPSEGGRPVTYLQNASSQTDALVRAETLWSQDYALAKTKY